MNNFDLIYSLKLLPGIVAGLTIHEFSHAWMAMKCGDNTSGEQGRITLNPLKHIDFFGLMMLFIVGFGWAKPVQFNENNLRNPKRDIIRIAVAGPLSNAIFAMVLTVVFVLSLKLFPGFSTESTGAEILFMGIFINWGLFIFNLIPLPPLDGSHVLFTPFRKYPDIYEALYKYGSWVLIGLLILTFATDIDFLPIGKLINSLATGFFSLVDSVI
jgi:Zn-dependent protease